MSGQISELTKQMAANQAAALAQRAILDSVAVKFTLIQTALREAETHAGRIVGVEGRFNLLSANEYLDAQAAEIALNKIDAAMQMDREQVAAVRLQSGTSFPDERIQIAIDECVDEILRVLKTDAL